MNLVQVYLQQMTHLDMDLIKTAVTAKQFDLTKIANSDQSSAVIAAQNPLCTVEDLMAGWKILRSYNYHKCNGKKGKKSLYMERKLEGKKGWGKRVFSTDRSPSPVSAYSYNCRRI